MKTIEYKNGKVQLIDQTKLPHKLVVVTISNVAQMVKAIKTMQIRGAPAIGVAAAFGIALGWKDINKAAGELLASRPTAVNLRWAVERMLKVQPRSRQDLLSEAINIAEEDSAINRQLGREGARLIKKGWTVLTHCNAGALATADYGTALGVIRTAFDQGKEIKVINTETRPRLQGAKLTAWELKRMGVPFKLISDTMVGYFMAKGEIDCVVVGADRIAANGDTANKIGTYQIAILAKEHRIPFYIAAPMSTIDFRMTDGSEIPIEERDPDEVTLIQGKRIAPQGIKVGNPAFDVTPAPYITRIITEQGVRKPGRLANH